MNMSSRGSWEIGAAAMQRFVEAKTQESSALRIVESQRAVVEHGQLEIMKKNMAIALAHLERWQREAKEAKKLLKETVVKEAEKSIDMMVEPNYGHISSMDDSSIDASSPRQVRYHPSITQAPQVALPSSNQARKPAVLFSKIQGSKQSLSSSSSSQAMQVSVRQQPLPAPLLDPQLFKISPEAKTILREVVLSAILHPKGEVDPRLLDQVMKEGLSKRTVLNAVALARMRDNRNKDARRSRLKQQLIRKGFVLKNHSHRGKNDVISRRANNDFGNISSRNRGSQQSLSSSPSSQATSISTTETIASATTL